MSDSSNTKSNVTSSVKDHLKSYAENEVWIVDDDKSIRWVLEKSLARESISVKTFSNADDALSSLKRTQPAIIFSDIRMPGTDGLVFLDTLQDDYSEIPVIIMTAHSDLDTTVNAFKAGAFEYLPKPFDIVEAVDVAKRAIEHREQTTAQEAQPETNNIANQDFIGKSAAIQKVFHAIGKLSKSSIAVLITGESGTGKELIAKALHTHSPRDGKAFIAINTAAIPADLLESELFGHEKGAFTGAHAQRKGRFEQADEGTLFLDEIGDMPAELQTRLLRVLADGEFYRVGGHTPLKVNVRVIAATHQNLQQRVKDHLFREDLFHRLNVINIHSPALRERPEDVPLLLEYFLKQSSQELDVEAKSCDESAMKYLQAHHWPGNIRQLENTARWLTVMVTSKDISRDDLPAEYFENAPEIKSTDWEQALSNYAITQLSNGADHLLDVTTPLYESIMIKAALKISNGKKKEAADLLGLGRNTLSRKITELGI